MRKILFVLPISVFLFACGSETATPAGGNAGATDTGAIDTGGTDTGPTDTGATDYACANGARSIPSSYLCDGDLDCVGGDDETGCGGDFTCPDGSLIPESDICNGGEPDCPGGEDESNCGSMGSFEP